MSSKPDTFQCELCQHAFEEPSYTPTLYSSELKIVRRLRGKEGLPNLCACCMQAEYRKVAHEDLADSTVDLMYDIHVHEEQEAEHETEINELQEKLDSCQEGLYELLTERSGHSYYRDSLKFAEMIEELDSFIINMQEAHADEIKALREEMEQHGKEQLEEGIKDGRKEALAELTECEVLS